MISKNHAIENQRMRIELRLLRIEKSRMKVESELNSLRRKCPHGGGWHVDQDESGNGSCRVCELCGGAF